MAPIDYKKLGPAVQNSRIKYLSVSSVTKFDPNSTGGCPTKWYNHYILGDKEPSSKAQEAGIQGHKEISHYVKTGQNLLSAVARPVLPLLPDAEFPDPDIEADYQIATQNGANLTSWLNADGTPFVGEFDLFDTRPDTHVMVYDHKFTGRKPEDLPDNDEVTYSVQMIGYGMAALAMFPGVDLVGLFHNYVGLRKRYGIQKGAFVSAKHIKARWETRVLPLVEQMQSVAAETDISKVPKNPNSCHAFNRPCHYASKCFPDPLESLVILSRKDKTTMPINFQKLGAPAATTQKPVDTLPPKPTLPPPGGQGVNGPFYTPQQQDVLGVDENGNARKKLIIEDNTQKVLPPDAPKSNPAIAAEPPPEGEPLPPGVAEKAAVLEPAKKRGRPPKKAAEVLAVDTSALAQPEAITGASEAAPSGPAPLPSSLGGIIITVDCVAPGFASLTPYVEGIVTEVSKLANTLDVRTIREKDSPLAYGGWKGVFAAYARKAPPPPGVYAVASNEFVDAVLEGLEGIAQIARGGRR